MENSNGKTREAKAALKSLVNLGLTATGSYYISDTTLHDFEDKKGYILYVLADATIDTGSVISIGGNTIIGQTLGKGLYHFTISKLKLSAGTAIVYRSA